MVLKKPYGILIKHFRLIHIILSLLMLYTILKIRGVYNFFVNYISSGWISLTMDEVSTYVNITCYLSIILILIILIIIYLLMRFKKKPNLYYLITAITYIISFVIFFVSASLLRKAVTEIISPLNLRIYRDMTYIIFIVQSILLIIPILRGIGFDVKKFNFKKDIADLNLNELDSEEIEIDFKVDKSKIKRRINKFGRTSSYIFLRNKIIIYRILLVGIIIFMGYFALNVLVINKVYSENKIVQLDKYSFRINKSYITRYDSNNNLIEGNYKYIVVDFTPINNIEDNTFAINKIDLKIGDNYYFPITTIYSDFIDIGYGYSRQPLNTQSNLSYIMVFRIPLEQKTNRVILRYINSVEYKNGNAINKYKSFRLKLNDDSDIININNNVGNTININSNIIKIDKYDINNEYSYTQKECNGANECSDINKKISVTNYGYTIMKLTGEFKLENKGIERNYGDYANYLSNLMYVEYTVDSTKKRVININSITPTKLISEGKELYIEVPEEIVNATSINLHIKFRNSDYSIKLK